MEHKKEKPGEIKNTEVMKGKNSMTGRKYLMNFEQRKHD